MTSPRFERTLGRRDAFAIVVGCIIGAGIFRAPASIALHIDNPFLILAVWLLGGLFSLAGALTYAELAALYPKTGGDYVYLKETYGPLTGFLFGWTKLFVERTGTIAILAFVFSEYLGYVLGLPAAVAKYTAIGAIAFVTFANVFGLKYGKGIQNVFTLLKVMALTSIVCLGLVFLPHGEQATGAFSGFSKVSLSSSVISGMGVGLIYVLWTYSGWAEAAYVAEEIREPEKNVPRAIIGGLFFVAAIYLLANFIYLLNVPLEEMRRSGLVASRMMENIAGPVGGKTVASFVAISTFGALNGFTLTGGRILYALAADHTLFSRAARVHPRFHTPVPALLINGGFAAVLVLTKTLDQLMEYTTVAISIFYALAGLSVILLRKRFPDRPRTYRVWGYPWTPLVFIFSMLLFVGNATVRKPWESVWGFALVGLGFLLYRISRRMKSGENYLKNGPAVGNVDAEREPIFNGETP
ncbi:MAG TPA: amino acid permease [Candidatus Omnitrophota bacterium]|nr:amino acid permease [Candidatus Omnitrophota bacterium]